MSKGSDKLASLGRKTLPEQKQDFCVGSRGRKSLSVAEIWPRYVRRRPTRTDADMHETNMGLRPCGEDSCPRMSAWVCGKPRWIIPQNLSESDTDPRGLTRDFARVVRIPVRACLRGSAANRGGVGYSYYTGCSLSAYN